MLSEDALDKSADNVSSLLQQIHADGSDVFDAIRTRCLRFHFCALLLPKFFICLEGIGIGCSTVFVRTLQEFDECSKIADMPERRDLMINDLIKLFLR